MKCAFLKKTIKYALKEYFLRFDEIEANLYINVDQVLGGPEDIFRNQFYFFNIQFSRFDIFFDILFTKRPFYEGSHLIASRFYFNTKRKN